MGTLAILRRMLTYIQSESHPIYLASQRTTLRWQMNLDPTQWGGLVFFLILLAIPILASVQNGAGNLLAYHDEILNFILFMAGGLLSLAWTMPFAMLAGQGISHERATQTWDTLRTTPYPADVILLAKASADVRWVWSRVTSAVLMSIFVALAMFSTVVLARSSSPIIAIVIIAITLLTVIAERAQEVALSAVIGIAVSLISDSHRLSLLIGLFGGIALRLAQMIFVIAVSTLLRLHLLPQFLFLSTLVGTSVLIVEVPEYIPVLIVIGTIVIREILIRQLFNWARQRVRED